MTASLPFPIDGFLLDGWEKYVFRGSTGFIFSWCLSVEHMLTSEACQSIIRQTSLMRVHAVPTYDITIFCHFCLFDDSRLASDYELKALCLRGLTVQKEIKQKNCMQNNNITIITNMFG